jgi:outer membrane protein TolC
LSHFRRSIGTNERGRTARVRNLTSPLGLSTLVRGLLATAAVLALRSSALAQDASEEAPPPARAAERTAAPRVTNLALLLARARSESPTLRAEQHRIEAARARLDEATFSPFFQLTATALATISPEARGTPVVSPDPQLPLSNTWRPVVRVGVEGAIPLYTFGKLSGARDAARAGVRAADNERARADAGLVFDVRRAYYTLQFALDVDQMFREGEDKLESAVRTLEERIADNDPEVSEHDRWRLSTTLAELAARRSEATRAQVSAREALRILSGLDAVEPPECPLALVELELAPLDEYRATAAESRPEIGLLRAARAAREAERDVVRAQYFPDLALTLSASYSYGPGITDQLNPFVVDQANYTSLGAGLVARWSLDIVGNVFREQRVDALYLETEERAAEARRGIALDVATAYYEVEEAGDREEAWRAGHRDARAWFVASASAYQVGALDSRDLVDAVRAYFNARFSHVNAIRDYNIAIAKLERAAGAPIVPENAWESATCGED